MMNLAVLWLIALSLWLLTAAVFGDWRLATGECYSGFCISISLSLFPPLLVHR
jgi:hypothetical protein